MHADSSCPIKEQLLDGKCNKSGMKRRGVERRGVERKRRKRVLERSFNTQFSVALECGTETSIAPQMEYLGSMAREAPRTRHFSLLIFQHLLRPVKRTDRYS